jgi:hypothetical protein
MAWVSPKTWTLNEILSYAELNLYLRDNMNFLYGGFHRIISKTIRNQNAEISIATGSAWNNVDSGGIESVSVGSVMDGDILEAVLSARMPVVWHISLAIYDDTTLISRLTSLGGAANESLSVPAFYEFAQAYSDVHAYMSIWPASASVLSHPTAPEIYGWMAITHLRPPTV